MNNKEKIIWAAGFLDGEGSFMLKRYKSKTCKNGITYQPVISCSQSIKGKQTIELLHELFGGSMKIHPQKGMRNKVISWQVVSRNAQNCVKTIKKYLIYKNIQAHIIEEFYKLRDNMGAHFKKGEFEKIEKLFWKMRKFNLRGILRLKRLSEKTPNGEATV